MAFAMWRPGMRLTETRANAAAIIGAAVFIAQRTTNQSIATGGDTLANALQWDSVTLDTLGGWSASTPSRWTATVAGLYQVSGSVGFNSAAGGTTRDLLWFRNGSGLTSARARLAWTPTGDVPATTLSAQAQTMVINMAVGDYVELVASQNSGVAVNTSTGTFTSFINVVYVGAP